uniref:Chromosome 8 open reading frame 33 n=1 Tax=Iconisemion striatum TaxID=60296 RepID=A0A1A7W8N9_9TELE
MSCNTGDIDAESKSSSAAGGGGVNPPLWTHSDNSFTFNFLSDNQPPPQEEPSPAEHTEAVPAQVSFSGQDSHFAFNFQIPPPVEDMDTAEAAKPSSSRNEEEKSPVLQEGVRTPELSVQSKTKKKKSEKKKPPDSEPQLKLDEGSHRDEEQSAEEQLNRQLDWCIEQLELGLRSQKGTPKQKEEASRALKTLRSSKAPLVKKRQVMRSMAGDYRKKIDEEKNKQFKLIQNEMASAQVKAVSDCPKKSVFHRKAEVKTQPAASEEYLLPLTQAQDDEKPKTHTQQDTFVFVPSKEEFSFNFF